MSKKIGRGELDLSDGQVSSSEVDGRLLFLEAVAEHRIGAFYRLFSNEIQLTGSNGLLRLPRIDVSKLIRPGAGTDGPAGSDQTPLEALVASYRGQTSEMRVFGALLTWARTVNLRETWCIKFAFT